MAGDQSVTKSIDGGRSKCNRIESIDRRIDGGGSKYAAFKGGIEREDELWFVFVGMA
jgi:hypothetical protein